ncbi:MAG: DUF1456 family protein [Spirochaetales bacterium]|nr:DUF1456 family protein [Spirochaetales bacterium]
MTNNDILKRVRYALDLSDFSVLEMTKNGGKEISSLDLTAYYRKEDDEGYKNCSNLVLNSFLDGLIIKKRGPGPEKSQDVSGEKEKSVKKIITPRNNDVMKKLKIALKLKDDRIVEIFKDVDFKISKSEINALFRRSNHKNFRECGDQILRNFLQGLTKSYR